MQYSLLNREVEWEVLDCCQHEQVPFLVWSPLKGGWLTGKFSRNDQPDPNSRVGMVEAGAAPKLQSNPSYAQFADQPLVWELLDAMAQIAKAHSVSVAQVAYRWLLQRPAVASVLSGPKTVKQLEEAVAATTWELSAEEMASLTEVSSRLVGGVPYPYEMVWRLSARGSERLDGELWPLG